MSRLPESPASIQSYLEQNGFINPVLETKLIVSEITGAGFAESRASDTKPFNLQATQRLATLWPMIQIGMPIQYLVGYTYVFGTKILMSNDTMCPSPELEILIKKICQLMAGRTPGVVLDLGTGSGAIAVVLARTFPDWLIYGTDISLIALEIARENCKLYGLSNLCFLEGNLFDAVVNHGLTGCIDIIVSAPPYSPTESISNLRTQVRDYAPRIAIDGGKDGVQFFSRILEGAETYLKVNGYIVFEHGRGQLDRINSFCSDAFCIEETLLHKGVARILVLKRVMI